MYNHWSKRLKMWTRTFALILHYYWLLFEYQKVFRRSRDYLSDAYSNILLLTAMKHGYADDAISVLQDHRKINQSGGNSSLKFRLESWKFIFIYDLQGTPFRVIILASLNLDEIDYFNLRQSNNKPLPFVMAKSVA